MRRRSLHSGNTFPSAGLMVSFGLLAVLASRPAVAQSPAYTLTELGIPGAAFMGIPGAAFMGIPGAAFSSGIAVNNQGQVVETAYVGQGAYHTFITGPGGGAPRDIGTLGGVSNFGGAVNSQGQVTGSAYLPDGGGSHAFLSPAGGGPLQDLGTLGGNYSVGYGVNDTGQVGGYSTTASGAYHAFLSGAGGGPLKDLGTLGGDSSSGLGINASGQVTGEAQTSGDVTHAFLSGANGGPLKDLGVLSGSAGMGSDSRGIGVNASGQVTGYSTTAGAQIHAFLSGPGGGPLQDLGTLGGTYSYGAAVNDVGQVVGSSYLADGVTRHAFLFTGNQIIDLNNWISPASLFTLTDAQGLSDTGYITGTGFNAAGQQEAFLLTPTVPEPSSWAAFLVGGLLLCGLTVRIRRKRLAPTAPPLPAYDDVGRALRELARRAQEAAGG